MARSRNRVFVLAGSFVIPLVSCLFIFGFHVSSMEYCLPVAVLFFIAMTVSEFLSHLSSLQRLILLGVSFALPFALIWYATENIYHSSFGWTFAYHAGCLSLFTMGISLATRKAWWLVASFLYPMIAVYSFWGQFYLITSRDKLDLYETDSLLRTWRILIADMLIVIISDLSSYGFPSFKHTNNANGISWGLAGLIFGSVVFAIIRMGERVFHTRKSIAPVGFQGAICTEKTIENGKPSDSESCPIVLKVDAKVEDAES